MVDGGAQRPNTYDICIIWLYVKRILGPSTVFPIQGHKHKHRLTSCKLQVVHKPQATSPTATAPQPTSHVSTYYLLARSLTLYNAFFPPPSGVQGFPR
eukprot:scaffold17483_cov46-Tisochrysis_lutea.AAC.1